MLRKVFDKMLGRKHMPNVSMLIEFHDKTGMFTVMAHPKTLNDEECVALLQCVVDFMSEGIETDFKGIVDVNDLDALMDGVNKPKLTRVK